MLDTKSLVKETNLLTKAEKAAELGISYKTLERWIKKGKISYIRVSKSKHKWFLPTQK